MKTQILRLEPHDDVISARDKMEWSQTGRILLVWPERGRILNRRIDLILLLRHSQSLGALLAVISRDPQVCYHATQLGIPVYKDLRQAQRSHGRVNRNRRWRKGSLPPPTRSHPADLGELRQQAHPDQPRWLSSPITRVTAFALSILALLSIAAIILPGAEITLTPQSQEQQVSLDVHADPNIDTINLSGAIPSHRLDIVLSGEMSTPAKGFSSIPDQVATVDLLIANLTDQAVPVPEGTVVRTLGDEPKRFVISKRGQVPAGVGKAVSLPARALTPGVEGNAPANSLTTIEGSLGTRLTATNPLPASGGSNRPVLSPTAYQREKLYEQLVERLHQQALEELSGQIQAGDLLLTPTLTLTQVIRADYDPPQDQPSDWLNLALTLGFQANVATNGDLKALAKGILDANVPHGYHPVPGTVAIELLNEPELGVDKRVSWRMRTTQQVQADLEGTRASGLIRGLALGPANEKLRALLPVEKTSLIRIFPSWWPRLPVLPFRITIKSG
jgi:hypothetical protein